MKARRQKVPTTVLERAKAAAEAVPARRPAAPAPVTKVATKAAKPNAARAKVVAALKKLHPMD